jgi:uncharacterized protein (TIRG00374 family)
MSKLKQKLLHSVGLIISLIFIYFVFRDSKISDVIKIILNTNMFYAFLVATLSLALVVFKTFRWKMILDKSGIMPYKDLLKINFISHMFNIFLPFRAGEVLQVFLTRSKGNIKKTDIAGSLVLNKFMELLSILILFYILVLFVDTTVPEIWLRPIKYLVIFSILFLVLFGFRIVDINKISEPSNKILRIIHHFFKSLTHIGNKTLLIKSLLLSLFVWVIELFMIYLLLISFGIHTPVWAPILLVVGINLAILIPATSGSFGPYEFSIILVLGFFSVSKETAIAFAITLHFLEIIFVLLAGLVCYVGLKDKSALKQEL